MTTEAKTGESRPAAVYRLFAADGTLLYIGSAFDPGGRCVQHQEKAWWGSVTTRNDEWHPSRGSAYAAEMKAIASERPLHNEMGSADYRETCAKRAQTDARIVARNRAGSAAACGAPRAVVVAIRDGLIESWAAWKAAGRPDPAELGAGKPQPAVE